MVGKKISKLIVFSSLILTCLGLTGYSNSSSAKENKNKEPMKTIGISQIVEHPALDSSREGFIEGLREEGFIEGKNILIDFQNAQGDIATADIIARKFVGAKKDLIFAVSTPSAQAAYNCTKRTPIVMTAITDPVAAGIVKSMNNTQTNVTGTSDRTPIKDQIKLLKNILKNTKKIGVIYNTSEANSETQVKELESACEEYSIKVIKKGVTAIGEVPQVIGALLDKVDVLYTPADNMIASSMAVITQNAINKKIPVFGAEKAHVEGGAFLTLGVNYKELGRETARKAAKILKGKKATDIPVTLQKQFEIAINKDVIGKMNIKMPKIIMDKAIKVGGGVK